MSEPKYIVGIGTGRCGTKSLAWLLKSCDGWHAVHEGVDLPWKPAPEAVGKAIGQLATVGQSHLRSAAVGYMWLWVARELLREGADVNVVCLCRPRSEFVESACAAFEKNPLQPGSDASHRFPTCDDWGEYWDIYMTEVAALMRRHDITLVPTKMLNEPRRVLCACGIPERKQATEPWHLNQR